MYGAMVVYGSPIEDSVKRKNLVSLQKCSGCIFRRICSRDSSTSSPLALSANSFRTWSSETGSWYSLERTSTAPSILLRWSLSWSPQWYRNSSQKDAWACRPLQLPSQIFFTVTDRLNDPLDVFLSAIDSSFEFVCWEYGRQVRWQCGDTDFL